MTTVSGIISDTQGNPVTSASVTVTYSKPLIGYDGGGVVKNARLFTTHASTGMLTMTDLTPGTYTITIAIVANASTSVQVLQTGTMVVLDQATQTLESALTETVGTITPSVLQQAIDAKNAAEAAAASASAQRNFESRAALVAAWDALSAGEKSAIPDGTVWTWPDFSVVRDSTATDISDLSGWVPVAPISTEHFNGDVGEFIAYLASASNKSRLALAATVQIPTDVATLQGAIDALGETVEGDAIVLNIETGHAPTTGVSVSYGNYSGYQITSTDATVSVAAFTGDLVKAVDAQAPRLSAKFIANGQITLTLTGAVTVVAGETITQASTGANGVAVSDGSVSELVLSTLDGGAFNSSNELSGSTSGGLGANSVPTDIAPVSIVNGYWLEGNSEGRVDAGCGVDYCYDSGLVCYEGGKAHAQSAEFNFAARAAKVAFGTNQPVFNSAAHAWGAGSSIYGEGIQGNDSGYYGLQASHGATAIFRNSDSQRAWRHGMRVSDSGVMDAEAANPSGSARDGSGSCIRCFENGQISAVNANATNSGASAIRVTGGGTVNAQGADLTGATTQTVWAENGGQALCENATVDATATFLLESGSLCTIVGGTGATSITLGIADGARYINTAGNITTAGTYTFKEDVKINGQVAIGTNDLSEELRVQKDDPTIWVDATSLGEETLTGRSANGGLLLTAGGMNATLKYTPAVMFGSTDDSLTTTNPKVGAAMAGVARETYSGDSDGAMGLAFFATPLNPGTTEAMVEVACFDEAGNFGVGTGDPDYLAHFAGEIGFAPGSSVTPVSNGDVVFELTSNTTLTIKAKGSDGVVRSGTVTLA
jgi:hypothetical protein